MRVRGWKEKKNKQTELAKKRHLKVKKEAIQGKQNMQ